MKIFPLIVGVLFGSMVPAVYSSVSYYTDQLSFDNAASANLVEDFESYIYKNVPRPSITSNGITYTPYQGLTNPNVLVASPGYTNFGVSITTSSILTAEGIENFFFELDVPETAIGFDTYLNALSGAATVKIYGATGLLDTYLHSHDPTTIGFLGITSTEPITAIQWVTGGGDIVNTGIDNIRVGTALSHLPVANAGPDQLVFIGDTVALDGSQSSDADGDALTYLWSFTSQPAGSTATLSDSTVVNPTFSPDVPGVYTVSLIVNDGTSDSIADTVTINTKPVTYYTDLLSFDNATSTNLVEDFEAIVNRDISRPLIISNGITYTPSEGLNVFVASPGYTNFGVPITTTSILTAEGEENFLLELDVPVYAIGFDTYLNDITGQATVKTYGVSGLLDTFHLSHDPTTIGFLGITSVEPITAVRWTTSGGGIVNTGIDNIRVGGTASHTIPVANAGPDQSVFTGDMVALDGSQSSDADGDALTYLWSFTSKPVGSTATLSDRTIVNPTFSVDVPGVYTVRLVVNDGTSDSTVDTVTISTINVAPVADAGTDQSVYVGDIVTLNGNGSYDVDGDLIAYSWSFTSIPAGSTAVLDDASSISPTFEIDVAGIYVLTLVVNDGVVSSLLDTVSINTINVTPVADAGSSQSVYVGDIVILDGSQSSDADGDLLTYNWSFTTIPVGSSATLNNPTTVNPSFTVDKAGVYIGSLIVSDGTVDSVADTVTISTINVAPIADSGPNQSVLVGDLVTLNGSQSVDADGDSLSFSWNFTSIPNGSTATLNASTSVNATFTADVPGIYSLNLIVNDGTVNSTPDSVMISAVTIVTAAIGELENFMALIEGFDLSVFNKKKDQKNLTGKISKIINDLEQGKIDKALKKLEKDILTKIDGCTLMGTPDKKDVIVDCAAQNDAYAQVVAIIALLGG